eukprot:1158960-Pelagomonas_calceolata.AAC.7
MEQPNFNMLSMSEAHIEQTRYIINKPSPCKSCRVGQFASVRHECHNATAKSTHVKHKELAIGKACKMCAFDEGMPCNQVLIP